MGRKKGMTKEKVMERNERIFKDVDKMTFPQICKKYGITETYVRQLVRGRNKMERETLNEAVAPAVSPKNFEKLMASASKHAATPPVPKELPQLEPVVPMKVAEKSPDTLIGKMLIQIGDKTYEIGAVSLFKA